jgi:hypothetical protein
MAPMHMRDLVGEREGELVAVVDGLEKSGDHEHVAAGEHEHVPRGAVHPSCSARPTPS